MEGLARSLVAEGVLERYELADEPEVGLTLFRSDDQACASVEMTGTREVVLLQLANGQYRDHTTVYSNDERIDAVSDMLEVVGHYMRRNYYEVELVRGGRVISSEMHLGDNGEWVYHSQSGLAARLSRLFGHERVTRYPEAHRRRGSDGAERESGD